MSGRLSVVATPIGNLEDITLRALRTLKEADAILAEDTRRTKTLCAHHGVATPLRSFHAHTADSKIDSLVEELAGGAHLALVTDAGTPLVSDPGASLVQRAAEAGVRVEPIPGPSAPLAALSAAGLRVDTFRFEGFLPRSGGRRTRAIEALLSSRDATVLFESPRRVAATLSDLARVAPDRPAALGRELTKRHEEIVRGTLRELAARFAEATLGEITIVIEGAASAPVEVDLDAARERAAELVAEGARTKDAAARLAAETGLSKSQAYALLVEVGRG